MQQTKLFGDKIVIDCENMFLIWLSDNFGNFIGEILVNHLGGRRCQFKDNA